MVAVHGAGHGHLLLARLHELEERHLSRGVLQRDAVHPQSQLRLAAAPLLLVEIVCVRDKDFLGERERPAESLAGPVELGGHGFVEPLDLVNRHGGPPSRQVSEMTSLHRRIASHSPEQEATGTVQIKR